MNALFLIQNLVPYHVARIEHFASNFNNTTYVLESNSKEEFDILKVADSEFSFTKIYLDKFTLAQFRQLILQHNIRFIFCSGYSFRPSIIALCLGINFKDVQVFACCESNYFDSKRYWLIEKMKSVLVSGFSGFLVGSPSHAEYVRRLYKNNAPLRIMLGYDVVDNDHFMLKNEYIHRRLDSAELNFIAVSRFESKKNLTRLLRAFGNVLKSYNFAPGDNDKPAFYLNLVGTGRLEPILRNEVAEQNLTKYVRFVGPVAYEDLPSLYQSCDILIHPSTTEQWGLVVNEAMSAGLAVLCSKQTGASTVLVDKDNGITFDAYSVDSISTAIKQMLSMSKDQINLMRTSSIDKVNRLAPLSNFSIGALSLIDNSPIGQPKNSFLYKLLSAIVSFV